MTSNFQSNQSNNFGAVSNIQTGDIESQNANFVSSTTDSDMMFKTVSTSLTQKDANTSYNDRIPDTTVSTSAEKLFMEATSSTSIGGDSSLAENQSEYHQPSSSSNVGQDVSTPRSHVSDSHSMEPDSAVSSVKKIHFCAFIDSVKGQCKQRAINNFVYCIRHILLDSTAPYKQCQHRRKPKNKNEPPLFCTNAIRSSFNEIYCSTHLIMNGLKDPKVSAKRDDKSKKMQKQHSAEQKKAEWASTSDQFDDFSSAEKSTAAFNEGYQRHIQISPSNSDFLHPRQTDGRIGSQPEVRVNQWAIPAPPVMQGAAHSDISPSKVVQSGIVCFQQNYQNPRKMSFENRQNVPIFDQRIFCERSPQRDPPISSYAAQTNGQMNNAPTRRLNSAQTQEIFPQSNSMQNMHHQPPQQMTTMASFSPQKVGTAYPPNQHQQQQVAQQYQETGEKDRRQTIIVSRSVDMPTNTNYHQPQISGEVFEETGDCILSKTHPQLAAKLLQPRSMLSEESAQDTVMLQVQNEQRVLKTEQQHVKLAVSRETTAMRLNPNFPPMTPVSQRQTQLESPATPFPPQPLTIAGAPQQLRAHYAPQPSCGEPGRVQVFAPPKEFAHNFTHLTSSIGFLNNTPPPRRYDLDRIERNSDATVADANGIFTFNRLPAESQSDDSTVRKRQQKVIKLRQKRQKVRIDGAFRAIPMVDSMCRIVENQDFDQTDLFPLGLEPSDDESSDDSFLSLEGGDFRGLSCNADAPIKPQNNRLELYLLKKQLRLESSRLVQRAKLCVPINTAARHYKNSVGAALRVRRSNRRKENFAGEEQKNRLLRCAFTTQQQVVRDGKVAMGILHCTNVCLPWTRHCSEHVTCNVSQQLFSYCKWHLCNELVSLTDSVLFNGLCWRHYGEQRQRVGRQLVEKNQQVTKSAGPHVPSTSKASLPKRRTAEVEPLHFPTINSSSNLPPPHHYGIGEGVSTFSGNAAADRDDQLNEAMDVSLASVAKDLGFDGRELTEMLAKLPVEEGFDGEMDTDEDNLLNDMNRDDSDEVPPGVAIGHSWADVEQFLLEQQEEGVGAAKWRRIQH